MIDRLSAFAGPELLVFDCPPEANVFPMVPAGAALSEMVFEENEIERLSHELLGDWNS